MAQHTGVIKQHTCSGCGYFGETAETVCPQCKRRLVTSMSIRIRGFLLVLCGIILIGMMGYLALWVTNAATGMTPVGPKFNGTPDQLKAIYGLFGAIFVFGLLSFAAGMWQLVFGRRNKLFVWIIALAGIALFLGGAFFVWRF